MEKSNGVAWTALIVAILALILAWSAFNRSGADLEDMVAREVKEATQKIEQEYQEAEDAAREETSEALINAGADAAVDSDPNNVGE